MAGEADPRGTRWTELGLLLMVVVWGVNFAVVKQALATFPPLGFNALRFALASLFVLVVLRTRGPLRLPERRDLPRILVLGVVGNVIYQVGFILGLERTRAGNASLMLALTPIMTALLTAAEGTERPGPRTWSGTGVSAVGVALVTGSAVSLGGSLRSLSGDLMLIGAAFVWAIYTVGAAPLVRRYGAVPVTAWTLWVGTVGLLALGLPTLALQRWDRVAPGAWGGLVFSAVFAIGLAYLLWYRGVQRIGNTRTAIFSNLTPLVALVFGALLLGEVPTTGAVLGAGMILAGLMLVRSDVAPKLQPVEA